MDKAILLSNGPRFVVVKMAQALKKYFADVKISQDSFITAYGCSLYDEEEFNRLANFESRDGVRQYAQESSCIIGAEHSCAHHLAFIAAKEDLVSLCQVLDYPLHTFSIQKDLHVGREDVWNKDLLPGLQKVDVLLYNQIDSMKYLEPKCPQALHRVIRYPTFPIYFNNYKRGDYILFSGRIAPDKGIHYLIDALGTLDQTIPLKIVGQGRKEDIDALARYAKFLNVHFEIITDCSEDRKWEMYHECRFTVSGVDNEHIAGLCPLEGIAVGRLAIVFDTPEHRFHYDRFAMYCLMKDVGSLARSIQMMYNSPRLADEHAKDGPEWVKENCSYEKWAETVYNAYLEKKGQK